MWIRKKLTHELCEFVYSISWQKTKALKNVLIFKKLLNKQLKKKELIKKKKSSHVKKREI